MTIQDKIDNAMLCAVVESRLDGDPLGIGDSIYNLDIGTGRDNWIRFDEILVQEIHVRAADKLMSQYPLGYRDPKMDYSTARVWCKTWAEM